ncbi:N-acetylneuraminate synthase family protein [Marinilabiliaceae bacterium ANBcel2]|nr:N-acetylneuraminate synthase family protein [Marinilabiliaceae bacterium ANBcel2]
MIEKTIIAEIGQAHDGSLGILHSYIDALKTTGITTVKFQVHIADAESSTFEPFRVRFSYHDATRFDYWRRMELTPRQWLEIKEHCEDVGLEFMASPFSQAAVDLLEDIGVKRYKVGSGEILNYLLLEKLKLTGKPLIVSTGMSSFFEIDEVVGFLKEGNCDFSLMQCTTAYPVDAVDIGLNVIGELKVRYGVPVGLSDHSGTVWPSVAAASLGANLFEFHVVFDRRMFGPDSGASLTIDEVKNVVEGINYIGKSIVNPVDKNSIKKFSSLRSSFGKTLALNRDMKKGELLFFEVLEGKKPAGYGIPASDFGAVIGKSLACDKFRGEFLSYKDIL